MNKLYPFKCTAFLLVSIVFTVCPMDPQSDQLTEFLSRRTLYFSGSPIEHERLPEDKLAKTFMIEFLKTGGGSSAFSEDGMRARLLERDTQQAFKTFLAQYLATGSGGPAFSSKKIHNALARKVPFKNLVETFVTEFVRTGCGGNAAFSAKEIRRYLDESTGKRLLLDHEKRALAKREKKAKKKKKKRAKKAS